MAGEKVGAEFFAVANLYPDGLKNDGGAALNALYEKLCAAFGVTHPFNFPRLPRRAGILERRLFSINRKLDAAGIHRLTQRSLNRYWREIEKGQDYREDAGGFGFRCWSVALGWQTSAGEITTHAQFAIAALASATPNDKGE